MKKRLVPLGKNFSTVCDICKIENAIIDGKTLIGGWAFMCKACHSKFGTGSGTGKGQVLKKDN